MVLQWISSRFAGWLEIINFQLILFWLLLHLVLMLLNVSIIINFQTFNWRQEYGIDSILDKEADGTYKTYPDLPYTLEGLDKAGRPRKS